MTSLCIPHSTQRLIRVKNIVRNLNTVRYSDDEKILTSALIRVRTQHRGTLTRESELEEVAMHFGVVELVLGAKSGETVTNRLFDFGLEFREASFEFLVSLDDLGRDFVDILDLGTSDSADSHDAGGPTAQLADFVQKIAHVLAGVEAVQGATELCGATTNLSVGKVRLDHSADLVSLSLPERHVQGKGNRVRPVRRDDSVMKVKKTLLDSIPIEPLHS